jgi:outer membrane protein, protease secretion system
MRNKWMHLAVTAAFALPMLPASALSLLQAYDAALKNDPAYRAAFYTKEAGLENRNLGRANLLPSINGSYSGSQNRTTVDTRGNVEPRDYLSRSATVQVRQPLFNLDAFARYKQGVAQTDYAEAVFDSQSQEVIIRVTTAYADVLLKEYSVALAKVERDALVEQRNSNDLLFKRGEGTRTDMLETQSRLDLAEAQLLEAEDALATSKDTLAGIIGGPVGVLDRLRGDFRTAASDLKGYENWKEQALVQNPDIKALKQAVEISRQEINKQRAGHLPRVDAIGTYGKTGSDSITTINQDQTIRSIGFQMSIPIFSGGAASAATRQAVANNEKAKADLQAQTDKVLVELRKNYNGMVSGAARIDALVKAVDSAKLLVTATEQSIKGGVRVNLDLLNAQRQLFTAQRDLAQARFMYMLSNLRLRASAGTLSEEDVRLTAAYFQ